MSQSPVPTASTDPVQAAARIFDLARAFMRSQVLRTSCDLRLFDALEKAPQPAETIARALRVPAQPCLALLRAASHLGLCQTAAEGFAANGISEYLRSDHPLRLHALANSDFYRPLWMSLTGAVREGTPRWLEAFGSPAEEVFAAAFSDPGRARSIAEFFAAVSGPEGIALARSWDFAPYRSLLDAGGAPAVSPSRSSRPRPTSAAPSSTCPRWSPPPGRTSPPTAWPGGARR